ncbi:MAG: 1-acyl-sn-glycerol-3-phosphate acyltransferase [Bacteroidales bacterium]|nr:1-acyl-sn-glycerol-3-phosphate acyltransferase [Bacteroidales bacterium]
MKKIYERDTAYSLLSYVVSWQFRCAYRRVHYSGRENIPQDGAVIYAPNHCNALMDALAVLFIDHKPKVFVARADIFKKPFFRKALTFLKIMPINRVRDGFRSVLNSEDTIEKSIEVLNNHVPFCILPEGTHRPMHSLLPFGKGLSRIALGAARGLGDSEHLYIVPVGLEYGDYYRYRSTLEVNIGKPVDITAFLATQTGKSDAELMNDIRDLARDAILEQIVWIPDDEDYTASWELCKLDSGTISEYRPELRREANQAAAARNERLRNERPDKARRLFDKAKAFFEARKEARVSTHATHAKRPLGAALWQTLVALVMLPFALAFCALSLPGWAAAQAMASTAKDRSFHNSLRFGVILLVWQLLVLIAAIVLACTVEWYWALAALVLLPPMPALTFQWFEQLRRLASAWRYACNGRLRRQKEDLMNELNELKEL